MPVHRPRFALSHLIALVALVAVELALIRAPVSWVMAVLSLASALFASCVEPLSKVEWFGIVTLLIIVWGLIQPIADHWYRIP